MSESESTYWLKYVEDAGWGGKTEDAFMSISCSSVEVTDGLVRFLDADGDDVYTVDADRVVKYKKQSTDSEDDNE